MKKGVIVGVVVLLILFISINFVSAGLIDWFKEFFGRVDQKDIYQRSPGDAIPESDFNGYIVEFEGDPILKKKFELEKKVLILALREDQVLQEVSKYSRSLRENNKIVKQNILNKIKEKRVGITRVVDSEEVKVLREFDTVFNGIALDISTEEAEEIRNVNGVKSVTPNYIVEIALTDSVPLIKADQVWLLDEDGNDCSVTGKPCLTGEGVTIGIIDTGIDYTHEDLGCVNDERCGYIAYNAFSPAIYLDKIVWHDDRNGNMDIYMYDLTTGVETQITTDSFKQRYPSIYDDKIVWGDFRNGDGNPDIYMYDLTTGVETQITTDTKSQDFPLIYIDKIFWDDRRNGQSDIYMYDLSTNQETQITTDTSSQYSPSIYGDIIVWDDERNGGITFNTDIYMYNLTTGVETQITTDPNNQFSSGIYGNIIVWMDERNGNWDIYMYDLTTGVETQITTDPSMQLFPSIYGNKIVWHDDRNENFDIYMYDLTTGVETQITTDPNNQLFSSIYGNIIVWEDYRNGKPDIYMYDLTTGVETQITGIDLTGLFPNNKVIGGYDFVSNDNDPMDDHGHGTHVTGIAAGKALDKDNDNIYCEFNEGDICGVAPDARLYAYKVLDSQGFGFFSDIIAAINIAVDPNQDGDFSDKLDIISLSLGGPGDPDDPVSQAIDNAVSAGVVAVIAAGNSGPGAETIISPGTARKAITVGATDKNDVIASFSSRGPVVWSGGSINKPDVVAPGVSILSAKLAQGYISFSGTSMATPHVSGAAALLLQKDPSLIPDQVKQILKNSAVSLPYDVNTVGSGRVDALAATFEPPPCITDIDCDDGLFCTINVCLAGVCIDSPRDCPGIGECCSETTDSCTRIVAEGESCEIFIPTVPVQIFFDDFQTGNLNNWIETNEFDWNVEIPAERQVPDHTSSNLVAHADNCDSFCVLTLSNSLDLTNYESATLSFWRYIDTSLDRKEYLKVEISNDNGNTWDKIYHWTNKKGDDDQWHQETYDLSSYLVSGFKVRYIAKMNFADEEVELDDFLIEGIPISTTPCITDIDCNDGLYCNGIEVCQSEICLAGTPIVCDDGNRCTSDSCNEVTDICENIPIPECLAEVKCWSAEFDYLRTNRNQAKKFCKCATGVYDYEGYSRISTRADTYEYIDSSNNENWETGLRSNYRRPIWNVECSVNNFYNTNQDYFY